VWKCEWREHIVAVKKLLNHWISSELNSKFLEEIEFLQTVRHPNIVLFYGAGELQVTLRPSFGSSNLCDRQDTQTPFLVTEYVPRGSLFSILKQDPNSFTWKQKVSLCLDVAKGMQFLVRILQDIRSDCQN